MSKKKKGPCFEILAEALVDEFPACCAINVLNDFQNREGALEPETHYDYKTNSYKEVPKVERTKEEVLTALFPSRSHNPFLLATTTSHQKDAAAALKAVGAKKLATTRSMEGPYNITLWGLKKPRIKKIPTPKTAAKGE